MIKPDRGFQNRVRVPEFEEEFNKIDSFRTHKYRQFGEKTIDLSSALTDEEVEIEANGIFIEYPVKADIRVNDLDAPKISALGFRYIGGYVHKIFITSPIQSPKLKLLTGVGAEIGFTSNSYIIGDEITGTTTAALVAALKWYCLNYTGKTITLKNTGATYNLGYQVVSYINDTEARTIEADILVGIAPGQTRILEVPGTYDKIQVILIRIGGDDTTYAINYNGVSGFSEMAIKDHNLLLSVLNETTSHTVNGEAFETSQWNKAEFHLSCTSLTGSSDTLDVKIQAYDLNTQVWHDIATFTQLTAAGAQHINISEGLGWMERVQYTTGGTVTDCDFKVGVVYKR